MEIVLGIIIFDSLYIIYRIRKLRKKKRQNEEYMKESYQYMKDSWKNFKSGLM